MGTPVTIGEALGRLDRTANVGNIQLRRAATGHWSLDVGLGRFLDDAYIEARSLGGLGNQIATLCDALAAGRRCLNCGYPVLDTAARPVGSAWRHAPGGPGECKRPQG